MNSLAAIIAIAGYFFWQYPGQASFAPGKQSLPDLEKRAVAETQRILAQDFDTALPRLPFANWFKQTVGPGAGIVWQLSECGETAGASSNPAGDMRACVEANAILPDGRRVIVMITVGTFKKGITGAPSFHFGVVGREDKLRPIRRLRDLETLLSAPGKLASSPAVKLPDLNMPKVNPATNNVYMAAAPAWNGEEIGQLILVEEPSPPAPPPPAATATAGNRPESEDSGPAATSGEVKLQGAISWGDVIKRAQPRYPARAKRVNASGPVKVQITIAEDGHVIAAKAISGHPLLREAAEEAARQWVFKPALLNGATVATETVLIFLFTVPQ